VQFSLVALCHGGCRETVDVSREYAGARNLRQVDSMLPVPLNSEEIT